MFWTDSRCLHDSNSLSASSSSTMIKNNENRRKIFDHVVVRHNTFSILCEKRSRKWWNAFARAMQYLLFQISQIIEILKIDWHAARNDKKLFSWIKIEINFTSKSINDRCNIMTARVQWLNQKSENLLLLWSTLKRNRLFSTAFDSVKKMQIDCSRSALLYIESNFHSKWKSIIYDFIVMNFDEMNKFFFSIDRSQIEIRCFTIKSFTKNESKREFEHIMNVRIS